MEFIFNKIVKFNTLQAVGIFKDDISIRFYVLKIRKKKNSIEILEATKYDDFEFLKNKLDSKIPILLLIDGKGVVNKKIDLKDEKDVEWIKNLDYSNIHFTSYSTSENQFLSFCRNHVLEEYYDMMQQNSFQIIDFYVGAIVTVLAHDFVDKSKITANENIFYFEENNLVNIIKKDENYEPLFYSVDEKSISNFHLPLYSAAINFYVQEEAIAKSTYKSNEKDEIIYKKAFEILGITMVVSFFCLLLVSYFSIQYFIGKNASLTLEINYATKSYKLISDLENEKESKFKILNEIGASSKNFISYYNYQIARLTPSDIKFSTIEFAPLKKEIKKTDKPEFDFKTIIIKGQTIDEVSFNSWIDVLKNEKWVSKLEIISIKKDRKNDTFFELKITIADV
ncbi:hypothetical protein [Flavobacterium capsici]|uniref:PI-PLC Y-box domain-containing protein n=1 Tax=Flavobacterium capsici TaxID=3075618 RepID=A0AA96EVN9_9FLAO|nr:MULTISPECIES: hypothetical protein [unclassified Flavobacterium]WNM19459.1 hypothetical protein RN608_01970 [Flavobacterium sp. PMR2A8]WNM20848.1 hypothetical protein RN605_09140 [Flavobacterium sp. PMTSA4]